MKANTKPYKIKLQKTNCLRSQYFRSTIHHEMIKEFKRNYQYLHLFFYLHLIQRKLLALYYISFNFFFHVNRIFYCKSRHLLYFGTILKSVHGLRFSEGLELWQQHRRSDDLKAKLHLQHHGGNQLRTP